MFSLQLRGCFPATDHEIRAWHLRLKRHKSCAFYGLCINTINRDLQLEISHSFEVRLVSPPTLMLALEG